MSKLAICMFGLCGGSTGSYGVGKELDAKISFQNYSKYLLEDHDVDFFIHSWSINKKKKILNLYKPKTHIIQKQKNFKRDISNYSLNHIRYIKSDATFKRFTYIKMKASAIKSFFYSLRKSGEIFLKYKKKNKLNYDFVIFLRFDLFFYKKLNLKKLKKKIIYVPEIREKFHKKYVNDLFFIMSPNCVNKFIRIYDDVEKLPPASTVAFREYFDKKKIKYKSLKLDKNDFSLLRLVNIKKNFKEIFFLIFNFLKTKLEFK